MFKEHRTGIFAIMLFLPATTSAAETAVMHAWDFDN